MKPNTPGNSIFVSSESIDIMQLFTWNFDKYTTPLAQSVNFSFILFIHLFLQTTGRYETQLYIPERTSFMRNNIVLIDIMQLFT